MKRQLLKAGIPDEDIPYDWLRAVAAAMTKWLVTTDDGLKYVASVLGFEIKPTEDDKSFTLVDNVNRITTELKNNQVWVFEGYIVNGRVVPVLDPSKNNPMPPLELDISERTKNQCESCGILSHCLKDVLEPTTDRLTSLCNYCISFHDHPRVNDHGEWQICERCSVTRCKNHPIPSKQRGISANANANLAR